MNGYHELANAIIVLACKDYRKALKTLKKFPDDKSAKSECAEIENFFRSSFFDTLTVLDGNVLIEKLKNEVHA